MANKCLVLHLIQPAGFIVVEENDCEETKDFKYLFIDDDNSKFIGIAIFTGMFPLFITSLSSFDKCIIFFKGTRRVCENYAARKGFKLINQQPSSKHLDQLFESILILIIFSTKYSIGIKSIIKGSITSYITSCITKSISKQLGSYWC
jgi:hypothetical protein